MCCKHSQSTECWKHFSYTGYDLLNEVTRLKKILFSIVGICCMLSGCGIASSNSGQTNHAAEMDALAWVANGMTGHHHLAVGLGFYYMWNLGG